MILKFSRSSGSIGLLLDGREERCLRCLGQLAANSSRAFLRFAVDNRLAGEHRDLLLDAEHFACGRGLTDLFEHLVLEGAQPL